MPSALLSPSAATWIIAVWLFALGTVVGSFLNVVVYRLPGGMSIVRPGSHCPFCKHPIRWYHNIPVLGWIALGGRCRDCRAAISIRYPLVEAASGGLFLLLGIHELLDGAANLPFRPTAQSGPGLVAAYSTAQLVTIYAYHLFLMCTLFAAALIEFDCVERGAGRAWWRLLVPAVVVGLAAPLAWPGLRPVAAWPGESGGALAGLQDGFLGMCAGTLMGLPAMLFAYAARSRGNALAPALCGCVGLFLGWQAAILIAVAATIADGVFFLVTHRASRLRLPFAAWLAAATLATILAWQRVGHLL